MEYVVFDEADRLFEMGFQEQLNEILARLSPLRQTLLFSATLPKLLVEFAKAGLSDPTLIRLDVDTKISENLKLGFFKVNSDDKVPLLIHLLKTVIRPTQPTVVFVPTKYHVDYLHQVLNAVDLDSTFIFSSLDPSARKINIAKFRMKRVNILLVTDVAARGIDIPLLDNVINFNFPAKTKLFVHRVGRVARAGRKGTAYSLVAPDELSYLLELHMFLSRSIRFCPMPENNLHPPLENSEDWDRLLGRVPQDIIDDNAGSLRKMLELSFDLKTLKTSADNALQKYTRTRPSSSTETSRRLKEEFWGKEVGFHPIFNEFCQPKLEEERIKLLEKLRNVRPKATIFEIRRDKKTGKNVQEQESFMAKKRKVDGAKIEEFYSKMKRRKMVMEEATEQQLIAKRERKSANESSEVEVLSAFKSVIGKRRKGKDANVVSAPSSVGIVTEKEKDSAQEDFIPYLPSDFYTNQSYSVMSNFERESAAATFDIVGDDTNPHNKKRVQMKWDRRQKKFKGQDQPKMIKTESGAWVPATYKKDLYQTWKMKMQPEQNEQVEGERDEEEDGGTAEEKRNWRNQQKGRNTKKNTGFISLTEVSSRNKPHPLMQGKKEARINCPKKGHLQVRTYEQKQKEVRRKAKVRQFHKEREDWKKKKAKKNTGGKQGFKRRY